MRGSFGSMNGENFDMGMGFQPSCSSSCSGKGGCGCGCGYGDTGPFPGPNFMGFNADGKGKRKGKGKEKGKDGREKGEKGKEKGKKGKSFGKGFSDFGFKGKGGEELLQLPLGQDGRPVNFFWASWTDYDVKQWEKQKDQVNACLECTDMRNLRDVLKRGQLRHWLVSMRAELKHEVKRRSDRRHKAPKTEAMGTLKANWVVHLPPQLLQDEGVPLEESLSSKLREVQLKLEGLVPTGCTLTVRVNGREAALQRNEIQSKRGEVKHAPSKHETTFKVSRAEVEAKHSTEGERGSGSEWTADLAPSICLDCCTLVARTDQKLLVPTIDVVEAHDTSVVLNLGNLTGETFELTVYASGCAVSAASTLVQKGPVRGSESVHRIGPLEASQVYVAWVKVLIGNKFEESKQKGFKTKQAKEKTIWDEKDHIILGVSEDATSKEIVKAWRMKSLQFHPDKVPDDQKEEAEEMMKRLNLAKVNMMKFARSDTPVDDVIPEQNDDEREDSEVPEDFNVPEYFEGSDAGAPYMGTADGDEVSEDEPNAADSCDEEAEVNIARSEADAQDGRVRCSLKIQAKNPPSLRVVESGLQEIELEASGLTPGCHVQVLKGDDDLWTAVTELELASSSTMHFHIPNLLENTSYRFRLRAELPVEPLRMKYLRFEEEDEDEEEEIPFGWPEDL